MEPQTLIGTNLSAEDQALLEKLEARRAELRARGAYDLPASGFEPPPIPRSGLAAAKLVPPSAPATNGTWEPGCVTCSQPLGYRCSAQRYDRNRSLQCDACRAKLISERLSKSGITFVESDESLDDYRCPTDEHGRYLSFLRRFAMLKPRETMRPPFAWVCGANGVGKSAGAQRALGDAIRRGCQGRFIRLGRLLDEIYSSYGSEHSDDMLVFYSRLHLLVVDDVGQEDPTGHAMRRFFELVDDRLTALLPTIFTSNYNPSAQSLGRRMTERVTDETQMRATLDRIQGGVGGNFFVLVGATQRPAAYERKRNGQLPRADAPATTLRRSASAQERTRHAAK